MKSRQVALVSDERPATPAAAWGHLAHTEATCLVDLYICAPQVHGWFPTQNPRELRLSDALKRARTWQTAIAHQRGPARRVMAFGVRVRTREEGAVIFCVAPEGVNTGDPVGSLPTPASPLALKPKRKRKNR